MGYLNHIQALGCSLGRGSTQYNIFILQFFKLAAAKVEKRYKMKKIRQEGLQMAK